MIWRGLLFFTESLCSVLMGALLPLPVALLLSVATSLIVLELAHRSRHGQDVS